MTDSPNIKMSLHEIHSAIAILDALMERHDPPASRVLSDLDLRAIGEVWTTLHTIRERLEGVVR